MTINGPSAPSEGGGGEACRLSRIQAAETRARHTGALRPIATASHVLERNGLRYLVRILERVHEKEQARAKQDASEAQGDPFLPYEVDLFVGDLGRHHVALLNKFPVLRHHLLIVTRRFEHQACPLTLEDMHALHRCLRRAGGLGFYNSGKTAGASQAHKHLQWVPTPLGSGARDEVPVGPWLTPEALRAGRVAQFPFRHAVHALPGTLGSAHGAVVLLEAYRRLLERLRLRDLGDGRLPPYNLLVTRRWIMVIPRSREHWEGVSVNALGFAGAFLLRDATQLSRLRRVGPLQVLAAVGVPQR